MSIAVILITLLLVYRSITTVFFLLLVVGIELQAARGVVALLGHHGFIGLTTFAVNLVASLVIAAGTDYGIFFVGRYQEARQAGEDRETAYYTTFRGVAKVVLASGLTIAGALLCLSFTRLPFFQVLGIPCAVGVLVAVAVAVTLFPALIAVGGRFRLFDPKRKIKVRGWRRVGTAIVRWPGTDSRRITGCRARRTVDPAGLQTRATTTRTICPRTFPPVSVSRPHRGISRRRQ